MAITVAVGVVCARLSHILDDSQSADDFAERCVARRQRRLIAVYEEELASVGARTGVRHGDRALGVLGSRQILISELVPRAASASSRGVTALQHIDAGGGEPVAGGVAEVVLVGQVDERVDGARRLVVEQVKDDGAPVGLDRGLVLGGLEGRLGRRNADLAGGGAVRGVRAVAGGLSGQRRRGRCGGRRGGGGRCLGVGGGGGSRGLAAAAGQGDVTARAQRYHGTAGGHDDADLSPSLGPLDSPGLLPPVMLAGELALALLFPRHAVALLPLSMDGVADLRNFANRTWRSAETAPLLSVRRAGG